MTGHGAPPPGGGWLDGDAGRMARPYAVTGGRTSPAVRFGLMTLVVATGTGTGSHLEADHVDILGMCRRPVSVAEIAAHLGQPAAVAKVLLSDLAGCGALRASAPPEPGADPAADMDLLERLLNGLQRL